jgi:uncharacterized protein YndB with AHSA1/START domain
MKMIVHKSITVARPADVAFKIFVEEIQQWWPLEHYSFLGPDASIVIEPRQGGRFYQTAPDGREYTIGEVLNYEPGERLTYTWNHQQAKGTTTVDIRFIPEGSSTRVEVAHSGWENLSDETQAASYDSGWNGVLAAYAKHAGSQT